MARLFCSVALLITVFAVTQAAPALNMEEKEDLLRQLLERKGLLKLIFGEQPTTTQAPTTTEEPEEFIADISKIPSQLTSGQICGMAQALYPPSKSVESKRDLVLNMIYHLCLPSVRSDDVEAIALILDFLRGEEQDVTEPEAPTTPEAEDKSSLYGLLDKLAAAKANAEEEEGDAEEEEGDVEESATPEENEGEAPAEDSDNGVDAGADDGADADTGTETDAGADAGADDDTGTDTGVDTGVDAGVDAGTDADAETGADADADTGVNGETAPAKRMEDAEFLRLLLKAVEGENEKRRLRRRH